MYITHFQLLPGLPYFLLCRTFSPEHITDEQAKEVFDEVTELQEQHGHEFSGEHTLTQYDLSLVLCAFSLHIILEEQFWVIVVGLKLFRMMPRVVLLAHRKFFSPIGMYSNFPTVQLRVVTMIPQAYTLLHTLHTLHHWRTVS